MEKAVYDRMWEQSIKPKIDRMLSSDDSIFLIDGQIKEKIWLTYEENKNRVHTYMHNPDGRIDRHKVASLMLYSTINNKPFGLQFLSSKQDVRSTALLANETLALHIALSIVWSFLLEDAKQKSDNIKYEIFEKGFDFPECLHDDYPTHIYKMLYYAKINNHYDIFAFSHILFLIEAYTELKRKTELAGRVLP